MAVFGFALTALSLTGSTRVPANDTAKDNSPAAVEIRRIGLAGRTHFESGQFLDAREDYLASAAIASRADRPGIAATALNNAGASSLARKDYRTALADFLEARRIARESGQPASLAYTLNNLASLYVQTGSYDAALQVAREGLAVPFAGDNTIMRPKLRFQLATALAHLKHFDEARPVYRAAIDEFDERGDFTDTARALASMGTMAFEADRTAEADDALTEALRVARLHRLAAATILRGLANVRVNQGDLRAASALFDASIAEPPGQTARWFLYAGRGDFRLKNNDFRGALDDFEESSRIVSLMRADIVPADQDRIALENGLNLVSAGLVDAGNRLALRTSDRALLRETFNAAETGRLQSLRALVPSPNDWRTRLPRRYWDSLARYQTLELTLLAKPSKDLEAKAASLRLELQQIEGTAGASDPAKTTAETMDDVSPLDRAQKALDAGTVLLSFHLSGRTGWVWAADRRHVDVFEIPALASLTKDVAAFNRALRSGDPAATQESTTLGRNLYAQLFGAVPLSYLARKRWLLELDGPLFDLPFAALVTSVSGAPPEYLIQHAALQAIPSALLLQPGAGADPGNGEMLEIGDPVYNRADTRYHGADKTQGVNLPRLTATAGELDACRRAWGSDWTRVLSGTEADLHGVEAALSGSPSIIHFATHVIAGPGEFSSGLIALSLDGSGAMGLMGPTEIVAHPVKAALVVMNGCHSARGDALPATGLMGLTRAWIGAGAGAVLATRWDIPDDAGQVLMAAFYRHLRQSWGRDRSQGPAFALQAAQLELLSDPARNKSDLLGAYFLLGRI